MRILDVEEAHSRCVERLGLDFTVLDFTSPEALAALIRRIASFTCPCAPSELVRLAAELLEPLGLKSLSETVTECLDALIDYGDLTENLEITGKSKNRIIYLAPPSFVEVSANMLLLFGGGPDGIFPIPEDLTPGYELTMYSRRLRVSSAVEASRTLIEAGFLQLQVESWLDLPVHSSPTALLQYYDVLLSKTARTNLLEELSILDHHRGTTYYRGRWTTVKTQTGRFVGRRPQAYGADLWCYVDVEDGMIVRLLDLPAKESRWRPCDEAWHLLQAIDAVSGQPQRYRQRRGPMPNTTVVDLFSPIPLWATRRWNFVGSRVLSTGSLFSYVFSNTQVSTEIEFLRERMWLEAL